MGIFMYNGYRDQLQDGDVLEWASSGIIGKIIQWRAKTDVSHTSGVVWLRHRLFTLEASGKNFHPTYLSRYMQRCKKKVYWLPLKPEYDELRNKVVDAQMDLIGTPYDYQNLVLSLFGRVSMDAKRVFCSEVIGHSLEKAGIIPKQEKALWPGEFESLGVFLPRVRIF